MNEKNWKKGAQDLRATFTIPGDDPGDPITGEERPWEDYWQRSRSIPTDFLRNEKAVEHPGRIRIADICAEVGGSVLECGSATAVDYPLHRERGLDYRAIDITPKFVTQARELYPELDIREASVLDLPLKDGEVDTAYVRAVFEHMHPEEWPHGVAEMWRVADKQIIIGLYLRPETKQYNGPLFPPPPTHRRGAYTRRVNQDHLQRILDHLAGNNWIHEVTPKVWKHRMNWIWVAKKAAS
jgi:SAM-dependent methyltransferase